MTGLGDGGDVTSGVLKLGIGARQFRMCAIDGIGEREAGIAEGLALARLGRLAGFAIAVDGTAQGVGGRLVEVFQQGDGGFGGQGLGHARPIAWLQKML